MSDEKTTVLDQLHESYGRSVELVSRAKGVDGIEALETLDFMRISYAATVVSSLVTDISGYFGFLNPISSAIIRRLYAFMKEGQRHIAHEVNLGAVSEGRPDTIKIIRQINDDVKKLLEEESELPYVIQSSKQYEITIDTLKQLSTFLEEGIPQESVSFDPWGIGIGDESDSEEGHE